MDNRFRLFFFISFLESYPSDGFAPLKGDGRGNQNVARSVTESPLAAFCLFAYGMERKKKSNRLGFGRTIPRPLDFGAEWVSLERNRPQVLVPDFLARACC